jgi:hypothetical protein
MSACSTASSPRERQSRTVLTISEISHSLYGAWRLAHFDAGGLRYFDRSVEGFWRSFRVAVLAAPLWIVIVGVNLPQMHASADWTRLVISETLGYIVVWVAYPLAAFYLTRLVGRQGEYVGLIVALNWASLLQLALQAPASVLANSGLLSSGAGMAVVLAAELACLIYEWFITRAALNLSGIAAVGFVLVDFVIGDLVNQITAMEAYAS